MIMAVPSKTSFQCFTANASEEIRVFLNVQKKVGTMITWQELQISSNRVQQNSRNFKTFLQIFGQRIVSIG